MSHPLDGATLRIERAAKHFDEFEKMLDIFRESNLDKVSIKSDSRAPENLSISLSPSLSVPARLSLPVSDCIHNLRAGLDYLVYELAILDSGWIKDGTQFPIEDDPNVFDSKRRNTYLRGVCDNHIRLIELLQPYKGVEWTKTLRSISNPDKHRTLVVLRPRLSSYFFACYKANGGDFEFDINGEKMHVKKEDVLSVGFSDGEYTVVETLNLLIAKVGETIESFKPEF
jgi:hypothetical protein